MSQNNLAKVASVETLKQLPVEQLVEMIVQQQKIIELLQQEIERLKIRLGTDSQTSSKPPSTDLLLKPGKAKENSADKKEDQSKRKPGGQPGHEGKTRKGFTRIDRYEVVRPESCTNCGSSNLEPEPVSVSCQQVAQLVERPIEVVEYQRHSCRCQVCGQETLAAWPHLLIPGQDLDANLQACFPQKFLLFDDFLD